jgi:thymidine kinase
MAKLYFRYGTMGSAKTLNLLAVAHSYELQGKEVLILKPMLDNRFGQSAVRSRAGLEKPADILVDAQTRLSRENLDGLSCILVDEAQFLDPAFVEHLRSISRDHDIPIICYGLRTDFKTNLFPGSKRLLELSDSIEEIKNTCHFCNKKAIFNARLIDGVVVSQGPQVLLGAEETYLPVCPTCYSAKQACAEAYSNTQKDIHRSQEVS